MVIELRSIAGHRGTCATTGGGGDGAGQSCRGVRWDWGRRDPGLPGIYRSGIGLAVRSLTCPAREGLAPGGWNEALPRPAPSAGVPLAGSAEQVFLFVKVD